MSAQKPRGKHLSRHHWPFLGPIVRRCRRWENVPSAARLVFFFVATFSHRRSAWIKKTYLAKVDRSTQKPRGRHLLAILWPQRPFWIWQTVWRCSHWASAPWRGTARLVFHSFFTNYVLLTTFAMGRNFVRLFLHSQLCDHVVPHKMCNKLCNN